MKPLAWDKLLQSQGFGSRKQCQRLLAEGRVSVGGQVVEDGRAAIDPTGLEFSVDGASWQFRTQVYLALNKPAGIECSRKPSHHPGVLTLFPDNFRERDVQPVGRLIQQTKRAIVSLHQLQGCVENFAQSVVQMQARAD